MSCPRLQLSVARQFIRNLSRGKSKKVPVQLLTDFPPHGVKGQIIDVAPSFMRNVLHVDNKACYITKDHGPRIPVVDAPKVVLTRTTKKVKTVEPVTPKESLPALSLDELSALFSNMKSASKQSVTNMTASADLSDVIAREVNSSVPETLSFQLGTLKAPFSATELAELIYKSSGIELAKESIVLQDSTGKALENLSETGTYNWKYNSSDGETDKKKIIIN